MTALTRTRVSSRTKGDWLMTRETVFFDTAAMRATSLIVGRFPGFIPARADVESSSVKLDLLL